MYRWSAPTTAATRRTAAQASLAGPASARNREPRRFAVVGEDALLQVYLVLGVRQPALEPCAVHRRQDARDRPQPRDGVAPTSSDEARAAPVERVPQAPGTRPARSDEAADIGDDRRHGLPRRLEAGGSDQLPGRDGLHEVGQPLEIPPVGARL